MDCWYQNGINFYISIEYVTFPYRLPGPLSCITPSLKQMSVIFLGALHIAREPNRFLSMTPRVLPASMYLTSQGGEADVSIF